MDVYLQNYLKFMKEQSSIDDTLHYISNNALDIEKIFKIFEQFINLTKILDLIDSSSFYSNHNKRDKIALLLNFFNILHYYSKNLMLDYDYYSTKSIKESSGNIRNCLVHIPNYSNYLSSLLGYNFDVNANEWIITDEFMNAKQLKFAALCLFCAHGYRTLTDLKDTTACVNDNDSCQEKSDNRQQSPLNKKWRCELCTYINLAADVNCSTCYSVRPIIITQTAKIPPSGHWECKSCTYMSLDAKVNCDICGQMKPASTSLSSSITVHSPDDRISSSLPTNPVPLSKSIKIVKQGWTCKQCTYVNKVDDANCSVCFNQSQIPIEKKNQLPQDRYENKRPMSNQYRRNHSPESMIKDLSSESKINDLSPDEKIKDHSPESMIKDRSSEKKINDHSHERNFKNLTPDNKIKDNSPDIKIKHHSLVHKSKENIHPTQHKSQINNSPPQGSSQPKTISYPKNKEPGIAMKKIENIPQNKSDQNPTKNSTSRTPDKKGDFESKIPSDDEQRWGKLSPKTQKPVAGKVNYESKKKQSSIKCSKCHVDLIPDTQASIDQLCNKCSRNKNSFISFITCGLIK